MTLAILSALCALAQAVPPATSEPKPAPAPPPAERSEPSADEPLAKAASLEKAAAMLDMVALGGTSERKCGSCHSNDPYLIARPTLRGFPSSAMSEARSFLETRVAHWDDPVKETKPRWDAEVVSTSTPPRRDTRIIRTALVQFSNPRSIQGWGDVIDPDGDCKFTLQGGKLSINVPGTLHDLAAEIGKLDAPAVLTDAEEDFAATLYVAEKLAPGGQCTRPGFLPYNGTGLLLWNDPGNYVRHERAAILRDGKIVTYVNFELHEKGRRHEVGVGVPDAPIHLRLVRRGTQITGSVSGDGKTWKDLQTLTVDYPTKVKIGVVAVNSSTQPFTAVLEGFHVGPAGKPNAR